MKRYFLIAFVAWSSLTFAANPCKKHTWKDLQKVLDIAADQITVDGQNRVRSIVAHRTEPLTKPVYIPTWISCFDQIERLVLTGFDLPFVPQELGQLQHLYDLDLSHNRLTELPASLKQLRHLRALNLSHNQLKVVPPVLALLAIQALNLSHNQLTHLPEGFAKLRHLSSLNLSANAFVSVPQAMLNRLPSLRELYWIAAEGQLKAELEAFEKQHEQMKVWTQ